MISVGNKLLVVDNENKRFKRFRICFWVCVDYFFLDDLCGGFLFLFFSYVVIIELEVNILFFISLEGILILSLRRKIEKKY